MQQTVLAISGVKNSGKTTLITRLLPHLQAAGLRVAVIKHDGHRFLSDPLETDTGKFMEAGAVGTAIFDGEKFKVIRRRPVDESALLSMFPDAQLILLEGFKHSRWPKLEVVRAANSQTPVCDGSHLLAVVTDLPLSIPQPVLPLDEPERITQFILQYLNDQEESP